MAGLFGQMSPTIPGTNQPNPNYSARIGQLMAGAGPQQQQPPQQPQQSGPPNNWQAALTALANPGNPQTMGANVAPSNTFAPSPGVNQAFLQQAAGRPGGNQGFQSALAAIQGRQTPQW
jgi:hypothetical protein